MMLQRWVLVAALGAAMMSSALAVEPFVGRWAAKPEVCSSHGGDSAATAALVATNTTLWWFAGYCRIGKMYKAGQAVYVQAHCGDKGDVPITLDRHGDHLRVTWARAKPEAVSYTHLTRR